MPYADPPLAGRYALLDVLGAGGMGTVWRAWDLHEHRFVAVKVLRQDPAAHGSASLLGFVREQSLRIPHPHVAAPIAWVADDDRVAFAMELARGGTLADLVADRRGEPCGATYVAELLAQLLDGLTAVHAAGVVHRDLKPANLLLDATGRGRPHLRIGDFGVAALLGRAPDVDATAAGTPGFGAPEQLAGAVPDPRQDLYAVGTIARRLLGRAPSALDTLVADLTSVDPDRRPASAEQAGRRLAALHVGRPLLRPRVPDRIATAAVPVPVARRRPSPPRPVPTWVCATSFVASGAASASLVLALVPG